VKKSLSLNDPEYPVTVPSNIGGIRLATRGSQLGNFPPNFSKRFFVVRYNNKLQPFFPLPKISANCALGDIIGYLRVKVTL